MEGEKEKRCRLCLSDDIIEDSIFDLREDGVAFSTKIMLCTTIMMIITQRAFVTTVLTCWTFSLIFETPVLKL